MNNLTARTLPGVGYIAPDVMKMIINQDKAKSVSLGFLSLFKISAFLAVQLNLSLTFCELQSSKDRCCYPIKPDGKGAY